MLIEKLKIFPDEIDRPQQVAQRYSKALGDVATVPAVPAGSTSVWAQYTIRVAGRPARRACSCAASPRAFRPRIYYPIPLHRQHGL